MGSPVDPVFGDRDVFADFFTRYYTDWEPESAIVAVAEGQVVGYLLACVRHRLHPWAQAMIVVLRIVPKIAARLLSVRYRGRDLRFLLWFITRSFFETPVSPAGAAHFHFNIVPEWRGTAVGRRLLFPFLKALPGRGVRRVFGQIQIYEDRRPIRIFERYGFKLLDRRRVTKFASLTDRVVHVATFCRELGPPAAGRALIVSFHDLHPGSRAACERFLEDARGAGVGEVSLLVTPNWHGRERIEGDPDFLAWLKRMQTEGHEVCLHGLTHRAERLSGGPWARWVGRVYTDGEGEFYQLGVESAARRIRDGLAALETAGIHPKGFVAPAWLLSPGGLEAAKEMGLTYTTRLHRVVWLQRGHSIYAPALVWSSRSPWRRLASRCWGRVWLAISRRQAVMRLCVHPGDWEHADVRRTILDVMRRAMKDRSACSYSHYVERVGAA